MGIPLSWVPCSEQTVCTQDGREAWMQVVAWNDIARAQTRDLFGQRGGLAFQHRVWNEMHAHTSPTHPRG